MHKSRLSACARLPDGHDGHVVPCAPGEGIRARQKVAEAVWPAGIGQSQGFRNQVVNLADRARNFLHQAILHLAGYPAALHVVF